MKIGEAEQFGTVPPRTDGALRCPDFSAPNVSEANDIIDSATRQRPEILERLAPPRIATPLLCAYGALLFLVNHGGYPLYTKGETREAVTVLDILHGGGVILPMRAGVEVP